MKKALTFIIVLIAVTLIIFMNYNLNKVAHNHFNQRQCVNSITANSTAERCGEISATSTTNQIKL